MLNMRPRHHPVSSRVNSTLRTLVLPRTWQVLLLALTAGFSTAQEGTATKPSTPDHSFPAPQPGSPKTVAESSDFIKTSRLADVVAFLDALEDLPHADMLTRRSLGKSAEDRDVWCVEVRHPKLDTETAVRVVINANIHAGEVEGKEVVQILLREIAEGQWHELLQHMWLHVVPIYNVDGNENVDKKHRVSQNGPDGGVGQRPNSQGLDLNRDFIKAESPECQALLGLIRENDPHVFVDLHTTNGSPHAYHLTYAPSLCPNIDAELNRIGREDLLGSIRQTVAQDYGFRIFDYGNFPRRGDPTWATYDHRPRFGTNYTGLRNRIGLLSEAFSYQPFETRVVVTRAFVIEIWRAVTKHRVAIRAACDAADKRLVEPTEPAVLGFDATYGPAERLDVLRGSLTRKTIKGLGVRYMSGDTFTAEEMDVFRSFVAKETLPLPARGWIVSAEAAKAVTPLLELHGIQFKTLDAKSTRTVTAFKIDGIVKATRLFQDHLELELEGTWLPAREIEASPGAVVVTSRQPLARLAAWLLEPQSDDSLSTWNVLEPWSIVDGEYPVWREDGE